VVGSFENDNESSLLVKGGELLTSQATINFCKKSLPNEVFYYTVYQEAESEIPLLSFNILHSLPRSELRIF